jgi:hypothetical protein
MQQSKMKDDKVPKLARKQMESEPKAKKANKINPQTV